MSTDDARDAGDMAALTRLLETAASGDEDAWRELIGLYGRRVFALVRSRCGKADVAEEVTQSVFVTVASKLRGGQYVEQGRFESWLFRIAVNRVRDEIRRQRRQATPTDPAEFNRASTEPPGERTDDEELAQLRNAMDGLTDADREVIELRHHGQMSFKEMADLLKEPVGTLLARHHRALAKLRATIESSQSKGAHE